MPRSNWKLHLNASRQVQANKIFNRCIMAIGRLPMDATVKPYSKGGYLAVFELYHSDKMGWGDLVVEVLSMGQKLGVGWTLLGDANSDPSAVLATNTGSRSSVSGLSWAEWQLNQHEMD